MNYYIAMSQKQEIFTLMGGRVKMGRGIYNPTSDAVWLAAFACGNPKTILDVGVGSGGVALCVAQHMPTAKITAIDISTDMLDAAQKNAELNNCDLELIQADIMSWRTARTFDMVITNPPYFRGTPAHHNAHHNADLSAWVSKCAMRVRPRGHLCVITDAATVATVISAMNKYCGDITILPLFGARRAAERVLLRGRTGVRGGAVLMQGLPMNWDPVLRDGLTIDDALARLGMK